MTATNHALTGALIGLIVHQPLVAIVLAVLSHFLLDALPHFTDEKLRIGSGRFTSYLFADAALCGLLVVILAIVKPQFWQLGALCAFLAASPDFMWAPAFWRSLHGAEFVLPTHFLARIHAKVQWFAKPIGAIVEVAWFVGAVSLLFVVGLR